MKKILFFAALVLGLASCSTDPEDLNVVVGGERDVMLNVSLPEATRSASNAGFDFTNFESNGNYDLRYILEIRYNGKVSRTVKTAESTSVSFPVRLAPGREYDFTVWADLVLEGSEDDLCYNTNVDGAGLTNITFKEWTPNNELRDAYYGKATLAQDQSITNLGTIELTRPFAKVRVISTDIDDVRKFDIEPKSVSVKYINAVYTSFNAVDGVAGTALTNQTVSAEYATAKYDDFNTAEATLFADYIFVPEDGTIQFSMDVKTEGDAIIKTTSFTTPIAVEKNKLTTIKGAVLTEGGDVTIKIENGLGELETINLVDTATTLQEIINNTPDGESANITLGGDIDLNDLLTAGTLSTRAAEPTYGLIIPAGKSVVLDLKGFTISQSKTQTAAYSMIENLGTLTIKDDSANKTGKINYADNGQGGEYVSNTIHNSGLLTIEGGIVENNSSATVASNGYPHPIDNSGTLVINDGTFTNNANYSSMRIWCTTDDNTIVTINGGTFNGSIDFQTPSASANKGTLTINGGTFNADTYTNCAVRLLGFGADVDEMNGYILGGHFNGAIALKNWSGSELNSKVFDITAGTFTTEAKEGTNIALVNDDYAWVETENGLWTVALKNVIAKIGEVEYRTLQKAFDAVEEGANTIVLVDDVNVNATVVLAEGKTATLDLNGFNISHSDVENKYAFNNHGTLIIKDSKGGGSINARGIYNGYGEGAENVATAKIIVESGVINAKGTNGGAAIFNYGVVEVKGGKFESNGGYGLNNQPGASMTITGGEIRGGIYNCGTLSVDGENTSVYQHISGRHAIYNSAATAIINNGAFDSESGNELILAVGENSSVTINGGTFDKTAKSWLMGAATGKNITFVINGGTFRGYVNQPEMTVDTFRPYGDPIVVYGGNFNFNPTQWLSDGYAVEEDNGVWKVAKAYDVTAEGATIYSVAGLKWLAEQVNGGNNFSNKVVKLAADLNLNNEEWTPIGNKDNQFQGTFDGQGHKIANLLITGNNSYVGLFGFTTNGEIKNLVVENAKVSGYLGVGVVAGSPYTSKFNDITVQGHVEVNGMAYVGGVGGRNAYASWNNITVNVDETSYVNANSVEDGVAYRTYVGGICGFNGEGGHSFTNITSNIDVKGSTCDVGGLFGIAHYGNQFENCSCSGDVEIYAAAEAEEAQEIGGIAGVWHNQDGQTVTMTNCSFTGKLKTNIADVDFYYGGLIGKPYSATGTGKLIIDGYEMIANGLGMKEGEYYVFNANGLVYISNNALEGGAAVKLNADINLEDEEFNGLSAFNPENNNTFDGQGHTVSNWTYEGGASDMGFIRQWVGPVKNIKFENCHLKTNGRSAIVAGNIYGNIDNVSVNNCSIEDSHWACGIVAGLYNAGSVSNVTVTNSSVKSNGGTGAIVGVFNEAGGERGLKDCSVSNTTINNTGVYGEAYSGGALVGIFNCGATFTIEGCTVSNNTLEGSYVYEKYPADESVTIIEK